MAGVRSKVRNWVAGWWLLAQSTLAGTLAWVLARWIDQGRLPFFAPIAAIVVLNFTRGERGLYAVRLMVGVAIGIASGELVVLPLGSTFISLAVATFAAMAVTLAVTQNRLALNQAGGAAMLTVIFAGGDAGYQRMLDALIGAGVALLFTQVIFSPEPVALVRRTERQALRGLAEELRRAARQLASHGEPPRGARPRPAAAAARADRRRGVGRHGQPAGRAADPAVAPPGTAPGAGHRERRPP